MSDNVEVFACDGGFPADSRFFEGHFPGQPIVPGAVILARLAESLPPGGRAIARVERMKFSRPLLPGVSFEIRVIPGVAADRVEWRDAEGVLATARVVLRPLDE